MKAFHEVNLRFFQDDASGEYGVSHVNTYNHATPFNAGWNAILIFHDVFEHWHEYQHKYFMGNYAMNVAGEMAASGATWYFFEQMGLRDRLAWSSRWMEYERVRQSGEMLVQEAITEGQCNYGYTLHCKIPPQKPVASITLERDIIEEMWEQVKSFRPSSSYADDIERGKKYKRSVTWSKIANTHRWGYRMAERMIPNNAENRQMIQDFFDFFGDLTKNVSAEELYRYGGTGIKVRLYKEKGIVAWKAWLTVDNKQVRLTKNFSLDDLFIVEDY